MKKLQWLWIHFQKNHSRRARQVSPKPLPILPPFQSPSPPPVPILGTLENLIDIDAGTRESPIKIQDDPEPVANIESNEEFPFQGRVSPSVVNDWEGKVNWSAVKWCGNCGSASHRAQWCWKGLTFDPEMGFWYTDKSGEIWHREGAVLWFLPVLQFFFLSCMTTHLFHCFIIVSHWSFHVDRCCTLMAALVNLQHSFHQLHTACRQSDSRVAALQCIASFYLHYLNPRTA